MSDSRRLQVFVIVGLAMIAAPGRVDALETRVYLEVLTDKGVAIDAPQRWLRMLKDLPLTSIRLRQKREGETFHVDRDGESRSSAVRVQAVLGADGVLRVPNQRFRLSDRRRMTQWIEGLQAGPSPNVEDATLVFGMTGRQLDRVRQQLAPGVSMQTKGESLTRLLEHVRSRTTIPIRSAAAGQIGDTRPLADEYNGVSVGTALAAALQSRQLALAPAVNSDGTLRIDIVDGRSAKQRWPTGWKTEAPERETLPKLFERLPVEIVDTPLSTALSALQPRLEAPVLLDRRPAISRKINPEEVKVSFPAKRTFYKRVLDRVLFQAGLQAEVRMDDANRPFIWVTSF